MGLTLEIAFKQSHCFLAGEIRVELVLRNQGSDPVETASLYDNNRITNFVLSNQEDEIIDTYNHITRQLLFEKTEPRTEDFRLIQLLPGGEEKREINFCTWHGIDQPGIYHLRGLYRWRDIELTTPPHKFEVRRSSLASLDYQWSYHYGEKYLLNSVWVIKNDNNMHTAFIRQSARFRPQVINYNPALFEQPKRFCPRVSFDRTLVAGGPIWVAWIEEPEIICLQVVEGRIQLGPILIASGLTQLKWIAPPLSSQSGELSLFLSGTDQDGHRAVECLALDNKGKLRQQQLLGIDFSQAKSIRGVCDREGRYFLLWHTDQQVHVCEINLTTLQPAQDPQIVWSTKESLFRLFTPGVLEDDGLFTCLVDSGKPPRIRVVWLRTTEPGVCVKEEDPTLPTTASLLSCTGQMNDLGHLFVLSRTDHGIFYLNTAIMQSLQLAYADTVNTYTHEQLIVTPRNDVYCGANQENHGLKEWLVQRGTDEDLEDLGDEEYEDEDEYEE